MAPAIVDFRAVAPERDVYAFCPRCGDQLDHGPDETGLIRAISPRCGWRYRPTMRIGTIVVIEAGEGIVLVHPPAGTQDAPASLPGGLVEYGESPEEAAVRLGREQSGLDIEIVEEIDRFIQEGTPFGPVVDFIFRASARGGALRTGEEGPAAIYPIGGLPKIIPVRAANQRALETYLARRRSR